MIQRIQSIYLLLAGASVLSLFALPLANSKKDIAASTLFQDSIFNLQDHIALLVLFALGGGLALLSIFLFNNRKLQIKLNQGVLFLLVAGIGLAAFLLFNDNTIEKAQLDLGTFAPLLGFIFTTLGIRSIKKDEKLVSSADRLR